MPERSVFRHLSSISVTETTYFLIRQYGICRKFFWLFVTRWCSSAGLVLTWSLAEVPGSEALRGLFCKINLIFLVCNSDCLCLGPFFNKVSELSTCFSVADFALSWLARRICPKPLVYGCDLLYCSHTRHCSWIWPYFRPLLLIRSLFRAWHTSIMISCFFIKDTKAFSWPGVVFKHQLD